MQSQTNTQPLQSLVDVRTHFQLRAVPFTRELPIEQRWRHPVADQALAELRATVEQRMSGALIAPAGTGKTVVARGLVDLLPQARYRVHYIKVTDLSKRDFCREVATAIGARPAGHYGSLVAAIQSRCTILLEQDSLRPVIIVDEAHEIRPDVLAVLRALTNFEMDSCLVVSIILIGQPALRDLQKQQELEAVSRRLAHFASLRLLTRDEIRSYVEHRLKIVGAANTLFDQHAHDALFEASQGNLRAVDRLALKSLQEAATEGAPVVGAEHVFAARQKVWP